MTIGTTSIPSGWYEDPAGSDAKRWWDGTAWTAHLQAATRVATVVAVVQPEMNLSAYSPMTGFANATYGNATYGGATYGGAQVAPRVDVNNSVAWISLIAGVLALGAVFVRLVIPSGTFYLPVFGLTAIFSGIRGISRYRRRNVTVVWAPIIGLVLGVIAEILLFSAIILPNTATVSLGTGASSSSGSSGLVSPPAGPTGSIIRYDEGTGTPQHVPESNATLLQATSTAQTLVNTLKADYSPNVSGTAADGKWPSQLAQTAGGKVQAIDGRDLGIVIPAGWHVGYSVESTGSFILAISGTDQSELAVYSSALDEYSTVCESSDLTCKTDSLVPPQTNGDTGQAANGPTA